MKCLHCGNKTKNPKFCNHSCSAIYNNTKRIISAEHKLKTSKALKTGFLLETPEKRKERLRKNLESWANPQRRKKQSKKLKEAHRKKLEKLLKEITFECLPKRALKRIFFKENGNVCNQCKYEYTDSVTKKGPFEIHHKDGDNSNWVKLNLEVLCLNCHWKTENYRFRGKKHTKKSKLKMSKYHKK